MMLQSQNTRDILSLMLGYDDLERLGELCGKMSGNRTRAANSLAQETAGLRQQLRDNLSAQPERLPEGTPVAADLRSLVSRTLPSAEEIVVFGKKLNSAIAAAEESVGSILGLGTSEGKASDGLADKLTVAVGRLETDLWTLFPSLAALQVETAFPDFPPGGGEAALEQLENRIVSFVSLAGPRIRKRLEWWKKESAPGSRATVLIQAARLYDPKEDLCPVCEQSIAGLPIAGQLASLRDADPELAKELRSFFADLRKEMSALLPEGVLDLGGSSVGQRVVDDWQALRDTALGSALRPLADATDGQISQVVDSLEVPDGRTFAVIPEEADSTFIEAASTFVTDLDLASRAVANLKWAATSFEEVHARLKSHVVDATPESKSLLARLAKGKDAAAQVKPLTLLRDDLRRAHTSRKEIDKKEVMLADLEELRGAIDELKVLARYAVAQVSGVFESIRDEALEYWRKMYPECSTGMKPGRLALGSGRDKSVEALLSCETYEVPGQYFANAGLQRAIALAFYFALLDKHPKGLGFLLLDDPILSLDDDHRERWSDRVLRSRLNEFQVILATHQRQYFLHCGHDFRKERTFELNPRDRAQRVSIRPGHELDRATAALGGDWRTAPGVMRQYREKVLLTLDTYSPTPFFDASNFTDSFDRYRAFVAPHPLAGKRQRQITAIFLDPKVTQVLDPGSHALTEASLTKPMVEDCLRRLVDCQGTLERELKRLGQLRDRSRRAINVPDTHVLFPELPESAGWESLAVPVIGRAAARSGPWVVDLAEEALHGSVSGGALVLVTGSSLDPVARLGQYAILAEDDVVPVDGDLVALVDGEGNRLLRRIWGGEDAWILQPLNPVAPFACRLAPRDLSAMRKVVGVVYLASGGTPPARGATIDEWAPVDAGPLDELKSLQAIAVEGDSLDPIARRGQWVLIGRRVSDPAGLEPGALAAIVTHDEAVGNVLKRAFPQGRHLVLVSPNPVDAIPPVVIPFAKIQAAWPFSGVLFEGLCTEPPE